MAKTSLTFTMGNYDAFAERYGVTFSNSTHTSVKIKPLSKYTWQTHPVDNNFITIPTKEYVGLLLKVYQFNDALDGVENFNKDEFKNFILTTKQENIVVR